METKPFRVSFKVLGMVVVRAESRDDAEAAFRLLPQLEVVREEFMHLEGARVEFTAVEVEEVEDV